MVEQYVKVTIIDEEPYLKMMNAKKAADYVKNALDAYQDFERISLYQVRAIGSKEKPLYTCSGHGRIDKCKSSVRLCVQCDFDKNQYQPIKI